ncbi:MAG: enoyl-CoA hydratase, partial [Solirubrobacteraceae bacterium]|nr:enoyl-CoA hydratase [Solirubrobacteraceae bacterium]
MPDTTTAAPAVLTERRGTVLLITLNRPEVRNAVNAAVAEGIAGALDQLDADPELTVGILTGTGGFFCAGMDLGAFVKGESPWFGDRGFAGIAQRGARKPLIAAIEGFAVAGGFEVALACDLIVAAEGAKLGIPEAKRSLVAAGGALLRLPRRMPYHVVMELALTGDPMPAERFHAFGVVNRLAAPGSAVDVALELAAAIASSGPLALAASKAVIEQQFDWSSDEMWARQGELSGPVFASEDAKEGASAFKEKREPVWRGRRRGPPSSSCAATRRWPRSPPCWSRCCAGAACARGSACHAPTMPSCSPGPLPRSRWPSSCGRAR